VSKQDSIIGKGWAFPPSFDPFTGEVEMVTGDQDIRQSLHILFGTQRGERPLEIEYGCELSPLLFQNMGLTQKSQLENRIKRALILFETRIVLNRVVVDISQIADGIIHIAVDYTIEETNNRRNAVYPFFIREGTLIPGF
jgi:phage baseplate assembly protein W